MTLWRKAPRRALAFQLTDDLIDPVVSIVRMLGRISYPYQGHTFHGMICEWFSDYRLKPWWVSPLWLHRSEYLPQYHLFARCQWSIGAQTQNQVQNLAREWQLYSKCRSTGPSEKWTYLGHLGFIFVLIHSLPDCLFWKSRNWWYIYIFIKRIHW